MVTYLIVVTMLIFSGLCYYAGTKVVKTKVEIMGPEDFIMDPISPGDEDE